MGVSNYTSFKTHSFRIGAASSYSEKGVSEQDIKRLGRWKSDAFKGYIRLPSKKRTNIHPQLRNEIRIFVLFFGQTFAQHMSYICSGFDMF